MDSENEGVSEERLDRIVNYVSEMYEKLTNPPVDKFPSGSHVEVIRGIFKGRIGVVQASIENKCVLVFREIIAVSGGYDHEKLIFQETDLRLLSPAEVDTLDILDKEQFS